MRRMVVACALALAACAAPARALAPVAISTFFDCLASEHATLIAAHRGGPEPGYAENAIATFAHTVSEAPVLLEMDVRRTSDGQLVLMHDETLDRTTTGTGAVLQHTFAEVRAVRLKDNDGRVLDQHPPTLAEALAWGAGKTVLELDVKRETPMEEVVREVQAAHAQQRVILITYNPHDAIAAHRLDPSLMISAPIEHESDLAPYEEAHVDLSRILAWTGTHEPNSALNVFLAQHHIEAMFGTLGEWDQRFAREGDAGYATFADTGLQLIGVDRPLAAYHAIDQWDGPGWAPARCLAAH